MFLSMTSVLMDGLGDSASGISSFVGEVLGVIVEAEVIEVDTAGNSVG